MKRGFLAWKSNMVAEFRKIVWPTAPDVRRSAALIIAASAFTGILIAIADYLIQSGFNFMFTR